MSCLVGDNFKKRYILIWQRADTLRWAYHGKGITFVNVHCLIFVKMYCATTQPLKAGASTRKINCLRAVCYKKCFFCFFPFFRLLLYITFFAMRMRLNLKQLFSVDKSVDLLRLLINQEEKVLLLKSHSIMFIIKIYIWLLYFLTM